ncbi:NADH-quinone oxidoreductase subunit M [candidate division LCP-89 bacterium B3_LCP]|uniref:NADH-quinone oxidoreductase subunit M n=1 Tax=candidate division LCP-89 bacterium B3_LCP TaxID=2012998 RepID=A0A532USP7_UNCL8|nr:MAG: NADH-quinone oxidoreductase subunit M [candidate division LCP-89 bacterium B3_LCP]
MLSWIIFIPLIAASVILLLPRDNKSAIRGVALIATLIDFVICIPLYFRFDPNTAAMQFEEVVSWIPTIGSSYHLGIDGISFWLILLTTFLGPLCIIGSWSSIQKRVKEYHFSFLFLQTGMLGVFCSLDLVLFYVFWEVMLVPMYLLIGIWGGPQRIYAAVKFFLFTMFGSVLMLVAILWLYFHSADPVTGLRTFDLMQIYAMGKPAVQAQLWLFAAFALAFAIKVPMFPFHTWLPDAHVEAPTAGSVILAGVLLKMGTYGFLRFAMPLFPDAVAHFVPVISVLAIIGIIYGALVAMVQPDMKKLVAYSSVSHLGFVMLGMFALNQQGVSGSIMQMLNHGISTGALFFLVGVIYERRHTRMIADYGGIAKVMPKYATVFIIIALSSIGLPGLNGFIGEYLILLGTFKANWVYAAFAATGVIFAAVYLLWMIQRVFYGKLDKDENKELQDLTLREKIVLYPLVAMTVIMGVYPQMFLSKMETSVRVFLENLPK